MRTKQTRPSSAVYCKQVAEDRDISTPQRDKPKRPRARDVRSYVDRREILDRRQSTRFEPNRRAYIRREEDRAWRLA